MIVDIYKIKANGYYTKPIHLDVEVLDKVATYTDKGDIKFTKNKTACKRMALLQALISFTRSNEPLTNKKIDDPKFYDKKHYEYVYKNEFFYGGAN